MNRNSNGPEMVETPRVRESNAVVAEATVAQPSDIAHGGATDLRDVGLSARPLVLITRGRIEYTAKCPGCANWHRHRHLGDVKGPCGTRYELQPRRGRR